MTEMIRSGEFEASLEYVVFECARRGDTQNLQRLLERHHDLDLEWVYPGERRNRPLGTALVQACRNMQYPCALLLLTHGADAMAPMKPRGTPCFTYCERQQEQYPTPELGEFLATMAEKLTSANKALIHFTNLIKTDSVKEFMQDYATADVGIVENMMLLQRALKTMRAEIVDFLMQDGVRINVPGDMNELQVMTMLARTEGNEQRFEDCARVLLNHGVPIDLEPGKYPIAPLNSAAKFGKAGAASVLLKLGADPDITYNNCNWRAINTAAYEQHNNVLKVLIDGGSKMSSTEIGYNLLLHAFRFNSMPVFESLVARGLHQHEQVNGLHALQYLCSYNSYSYTHLDKQFIEDAIECLLNHDVDVNMTTEKGWSGLMLAAKSNNYEAFVKLIDRGASLDIESTKGKTVFDIITPVIHMQFIDKINSKRHTNKPQ